MLTLKEAQCWSADSGVPWASRATDRTDRRLRAIFMAMLTGWLACAARFP